MLTSNSKVTIKEVTFFTFTFIFTYTLQLSFPILNFNYSLTVFKSTSSVVKIIIF